MSVPETSYGTYPENDRPHDEDRKKSHNVDYEYDESDTSSVEVLTGVSKVEAAQAVWFVPPFFSQFSQ